MITTCSAGRRLQCQKLMKAGVTAGACVSASPRTSTVSPIATARCAPRRASGISSCRRRVSSCLSGEDDLTTYTFNTGVAKHTFCRHCGIHPFYVPRSDPDKIDVNARCLDGVDLDTIAVEALRRPELGNRHREGRAVAVARPQAEEAPTRPTASYRQSPSGLPC